MDEDLLPHRAAVGILQVVHLVHDDGTEALERPAPGVEHVAQDHMDRADGNRRATPPVHQSCFAGPFRDLLKRQRSGGIPTVHVRDKRSGFGVSRDDLDRVSSHSYII